MTRIVVAGSLNADLVQPLSRMPVPGETVLAGELRVIPGGKGANQAVAAGRLGGAVSMIGEVGGDQFANVLIASLGSAGVGTSGVGRSPGASGTACILVLPDGENLIVVSPAANGKLTPEMVEARVGEMAPDTIVLCQLEIPMGTTAWTLAQARRAGAVTILDPAPAQTLDRELLRNVTWLTPNQTEAALLLGGGRAAETYAEAEDAARHLLAMGPQNVVVKLGRQGCLLAGDGFCHAIPGFAVDAVDTTAAGDTFNGAFAVALGEGRDLRAAGRFANAAAALSVMQMGAQSSIPDRGAVDGFLKAHPED